MNELIEFLTSKEVLIVVSIAMGILVIGTIYFIIEKVVRNRKLEAVEKNFVVEELVEEDAPVLEQIMTEQKQEAVVTIEKEESVPITNEVIEQKEEKKVIEEIYQEVKEEVKKQEELAYTEIVPNKEEARKELEKVTEELIKQEESQNIELTKFEAEQEENAIISMDELLQRSGVLYQKNEITQYLDEGNEPISLTDLEERRNQMKVDVKEVTPEPTKIVEEVIPPVLPIEELKMEELKTESVKVEPVKKAYQESNVFKSSPIISPIFGIEKQESTPTSMELENTANYPKFDEEMKKTNEFLTTLKELQKNLE